jgi:hypothetical protein
MEMIDVITRLREIADKSPEIEKALESATRMTAKRVDEGVQITVSGSDAVLHQILKLAGLIGAETVEAPDSLSHTSMPHDTMSHHSMGPDHMGADHMDLEIVPEGDRPYSHGREDTYGASTSPDEVVLDFDTAIPQGTDLHGLGADGYNKIAGGGNPMRPRP